MKRIYLIDCPGVVPPSNNDTEQDILLRGVVRVENVEHPEQYIAGVLKRTQPRHIEKTYDIRGYEDSYDFLSILARKGGRLMKGGEPDVDGVAKMVINDFLRGKIPWFTPPPHTQDGNDGSEDAAGEGSRKRKLDDDDVVGSQGSGEGSGDEDETSDSNEFQGFDDDEEDDEMSEVNTEESKPKS